MPGEEPMTHTSGVKLTYDDLLALPDDHFRHELIDGAHFVTPPPLITHQRVLGKLHRALANWLDEHPDGDVYFAPVDVVFSRFDVVEPDLLFVSASRAPQIVSDRNVGGAPDLVVEIASPSTRKYDAGTKLRLYEREGVREYWTVEPVAEAVRVYTRGASGFSAPTEHSSAGGGALTTPLLPGFVLTVADLFRK